MDNVGDWLYCFPDYRRGQWLIQFEGQKKEEESSRYIRTTRQGNCAQ